MGAEELEVEEALAHVENFQQPAARVFKISRDLAQIVEINMPILVHRFHYPVAVGHGGEEDRIAILVC